MGRGNGKNGLGQDNRTAVIMTNADLGVHRNEGHHWGDRSFTK
ncbi:hypothetical protein [Bacillus fonticola]|nr:hypothetical protein [Bacillus fonticola]